MNFEEGDIVLIVHHPISTNIGRVVEVVKVRPNFVGTETWYLLIDASGKRRGAAHSWLRRRGWDEFRVSIRWSDQTVDV